jgi:hypothetical protein
MPLSTVRRKFHIALILAACLIVPGLVSGLTFLSAYRTANSDQSQGLSNGAAGNLRFAETDKTWLLPAQTGVQQLANAHCDFMFENPNLVAVDFGIESQGSQCTGVSVCVMGPEEMKRYLLWAQGAATFEAAEVHAGMLPLLLQVVFEDRAAQGFQDLKLNWQDSEEVATLEAQETVTVRGRLWRPPATKRRFSAPPNTGGLVRVKFQTSPPTLDDQRIAVTLSTRDADDAQSPLSLTRLVLHVRPSDLH